jgi:cell filamentation protein
MTDPYLIPGTDVLRNKLGFTDRETLDRATHDIAESAALKLFASMRRVPLTMLGWQAVHRAMFGAVFDWAGQFRTIHIRKALEGEQQAVWFIPFDRIAFEGAKATRNLAATLHHAANASLERIADNVADAYSQMNEVHPFREGNGRSQKVFFSLLCRPHNLQLRWDKIGAAEHNEAARKASAGDSSLMRRHFRAMTSSLSAVQVALYLPRR